ncbi:MAG: YvcK family protein [Oscillospiraceae bacterium]|jgi:uncharacterized cofD-like protein|nr:YvcK family protein [Oscillospiraceae bacterium]
MNGGSGLKIVAIGGGTGLSAMLRGLKACTGNITAVVTVADDGGGSGVLRSDLGMLPPGDIRNCILALCNTEPIMEKLLNYRFPEGSMAGQSFGNLFIAALTGVTGSFGTAVRRFSEVLAITGRVLPVTEEDVRLEAEFENGARVTGESKIFAFKREQKCAIKRVSLTPERPTAHPEVLRAIEDADLITLGPGSLYTSVIPNLLVGGVTEALTASRALKVYICNLMTQEGETEGYTAHDHVRALLLHSAPGVADICLTSDTPIPRGELARYAAESAAATRVDEELFSREGIGLRRADLASVKGGVVRHDPRRLALALYGIIRAERPRGGHLDISDEATMRWLQERIGEEA